MKSWPKGSEMTMKPEEKGGGGKTAWAWDFFTVKDYTFRKKIPECGEQKQHLMRNGGREGDKTEGEKKKNL